tara:strand:+ start:149 stop:610 length:462 start_codon:yes stop_codon:yes gene_type:complete
MHSTLDIQTALPLFIQRCREAGIRNPDKYLASKVPTVYSYLRGAFPRGILPTDIDGEVELDGRYLRLEFKEEGLVRLSKYPEGQKKAFLRLVKQKQFTLFLIGHDHGGRVKVMRWVKPGASNSFTTGIINPCNEERLAQACRNWVKSINHVYN